MTIKSEQAEAQSCGLKRFYSETPCRRCGSQVRSTATGDCLQCKKTKTTTTVRELWESTGRNKTETARLLGVHRNVVAHILSEGLLGVVLVQKKYRLMK